MIAKLSEKIGQLFYTLKIKAIIRISIGFIAPFNNASKDKFIIAVIVAKKGFNLFWLSLIKVGTRLSKGFHACCTVFFFTPEVKAI